MLEAVAICSLKIVFMWAAMQEGMVFFPLRKWFEIVITALPIKLMLWIRKPLFDCMFCMSSIWGIMFSADRAEFSMKYILFLFSVGGLNYIIGTILKIEKADEGATN